MSAYWCIISNVYFILAFGQKYIFINETISGQDANAVCLNRSGRTLASIHSAADNLEAQTLCHPLPSDEAQECWISVLDFDLFQWHDGTAIDYQNWHAGEPNDHHQQPSEDPVSIASDTGHWNDHLKSRVLRLICRNPSYDSLQNPTATIETFELTLSAIQHSNDGSHIKIQYIVIISVVVFLGFLCVLALYFFLYVKPRGNKIVQETKKTERKKTKKKIKTIESSTGNAMDDTSLCVNPRTFRNQAIDSSTALGVTSLDVNPRTFKHGRGFSDDTNATDLTSASVSYDTVTGVGTEFPTFTAQRSQWRNYVEEDVLLNADGKP